MEKAIEELKNGGVGIFPTDTAFGIGCRIDKEDSVRRLFELRKRSETKAVPVLVSSIEMAEKYAENITPQVRTLMEKYWPGGLTIVLKCKKDLVPELVRGGGDTIGLRMPNNQTALKLIESVGVPILAPSANFSGQPTPYDFESLDSELVRLVDFTLSGECRLKQASTVIDSTNNFKILRQGAVQLDL